MAIFLLIVLTGVYFIRPYEWVPGLVGLPLFLMVILPCLVVSAEAWTRRLQSRSLRDYPISSCVLCLLIIYSLSDFLHNGSLANTQGYVISCIIYFLIVGIVDSRKKLNAFLYGLGASLFAVGLLCYLVYVGMISIDTGYTVTADNLDWTARHAGRAASISSNFDPNDTSAIIVVGILIALHYATSARWWAVRLISLAAIVVEARVLQLTDSRGGFLALVVGIAIYVWLRWGKKGLLWSAWLVPLALAYVATKRMTGIHESLGHGDTGESRMQFWTAGIVFLKENPLLGIGPGRFVERVGKVAHNSYVQVFAELGFVGGALFLGAFAYGLITFYRRARMRTLTSPNEVGESELIEIGESKLNDLGETEANEFSGSEWDPIFCLVAAILAAYCTSILTLSQQFAPHTYIILAIPTAAAIIYDMPNVLPGSTLAVRAGGIAVAFVLFVHFGTRYLLGW